MMKDDRIDVAALREALGWTQLQFAEHFATDRSTVSKWEREPPAKGPALVLLRQLCDRVAAGDLPTASPAPTQGDPPATEAHAPAPAGEGAFETPDGCGRQVTAPPVLTSSRGPADSCSEIDPHSVSASPSHLSPRPGGEDALRGVPAIAPDILPEAAE